MRKRVAVFVIAGLSIALAPASASAEPATATIDSRAPALAKVDGGGWTTSVGLTNLTDDEATLEVTPKTADPGCTLTPDKAKLPAAEHTTVNVGIAAGCKSPDDGIDFDVKATGEGAAQATFAVTAAPKPDETAEPDWGQLWALPIALGALLLAAFVFYGVWDARDREEHRLNEPLVGLDDAWKFSDSWVTNVTILGGILTTIFGSSEVVKALLGEDVDRSIALLTVGSVLAAALVAAGPIVLFATTTKPPKSEFTVFGLLVASAIVLAGAYGELWIAYQVASDLDLGGFGDWIWIGALAAGLLLLLYAFRALRANLEKGTTVDSSALLVGASLLREQGNEEYAGQLSYLASNIRTVDIDDAAVFAPRRRAAML